MTPAQRSRRIRQLSARKSALEAELRQVNAALTPLEREESRSLGFIFGGTLTGARLLAEMDRRDGAGRAVA